MLVPFVVLGELRAGFAGRDRTGENEANLVRFLDSRRVAPVFADEETTHHYARLFQQLRRQGTPIPTNDLWVAALVVQHNAQLYARAWIDRLQSGRAVEDVYSAARRGDRAYATP